MAEQKKAAFSPDLCENPLLAEELGLGYTYLAAATISEGRPGIVWIDYCSRTATMPEIVSSAERFALLPGVLEQIPFEIVKV